MALKEFQAPVLIQKIDGHYYEFTFLESSVRSVDVCMQALDDILSTTHPDETIYLLVDSRRSGSQPISRTTRGVRELYRKFPKTFKRVHVAFVHNDDMLMPIWISLFSALNSGMEMRTYNHDRESEARAWLNSFR